MRPLLLNFSGAWGGLEMFSADVFEGLHAEGFDVWFVCAPDTPLAARLIDAGHADRVVTLRARKYFDLRALRAVRRLLRQRELDLIHTFRSADIFCSSLATLGFERRVALVHHLQMLPGRSRRDPLHALVYSRLDRVLTITRQIEERVGRLWPVPSERVRTLYYGLDGPRPHRDGRAGDGPEGEGNGVGGAGRERARERFGLPREGLLLGLVGQVCEIKGQRFVLEAFAPLAAERPEAALVLAGAPVEDDPAYPAALEARIAELGLEDRVHRLGFCDAVPELMPAFDLFVLGSRSEAFGRVVIEAMAAGCLTVASAAGGVPEIIDDGVDGFLYPSRDEAALTQTLRRVAALGPDEGAAVRAAALRKVRERFSMQRFAAELSSVYREALAPAER